MELSTGVWVTDSLDFLNIGGTFRKGSFVERVRGVASLSVV